MGKDAPPKPPPPPPSPEPDDWIRWTEVSKILNHAVSKASVYRMMNEGRFPSSIKIEGHARLVRWIRAEVIEWKKTRAELWRKYPGLQTAPSARRRPRKKAR